GGQEVRPHPDTAGGAVLANELDPVEVERVEEHGCLRVIRRIDHAAFGVDDEAHATTDGAGAIDAHREGLVGDGVGSCQHHLLFTVGRGGLHDVDDDVGTHPGKVTRDFREPGVVADGQADTSD